MAKHPPFKDQLLYIFSSSELLIFYLTLFYALFNFNIYSTILLFIIIMKTFLLHFIKDFMKKSKYGVRPSKAFNCNMMNCGGKPFSGGFPSGHMLLLGMLAFIIFNLYKINKNKKYVIIYIILIVTTFIGRIYTYCHTVLQSASGLLIGLLISVILYNVDNMIEKYLPYDIYKKHKEKFYNDLNIL